MFLIICYSSNRKINSAPDSPEQPCEEGENSWYLFYNWENSCSDPWENFPKAPLLNRSGKDAKTCLLNPGPPHCPSNASLYGRRVEAMKINLNYSQNTRSQRQQGCATQVWDKWIMCSRGRQGTVSEVWKIILFWRKTWRRSSVTGPWEMGAGVEWVMLMQVRLDDTECHDEHTCYIQQTTERHQWLLNKNVPPYTCALKWLI